MTIKLLKIILGHIDEVERYLNDQFEVEYDFHYDLIPYLMEVNKYIKNGKLDNNCSKEMKNFITSNYFLFRTIANKMGDENVYMNLLELTYNNTREFIKNMLEHREYIEEVYKNLDILDKLGIKDIKIGIDANKYCTIADDIDYGLYVDYMDSLQLTDDGRGLRFKPTDKTKYRASIALSELPKGTIMQYGDTIYVSDIFDIRASELPKKVEQVNKYIGVITQKNELYKEKLALDNLCKKYEDYENSYDEMSKVVESRRIFNCSPVKAYNDEIKEKIDDYVVKTKEKIYKKDKKIKTDGIKVRI